LRKILANINEIRKTPISMKGNTNNGKKE
jgi:hypothetical protein